MSRKKRKYEKFANAARKRLHSTARAIIEA
jgi:hypothetical protein